MEPPNHHLDKVPSDLLWSEVFWGGGCSRNVLCLLSQEDGAVTKT